MNRFLTLAMPCLLLLALNSAKDAAAQQPNDNSARTGYAAVSGADDISSAVNRYVTERRSRSPDDSTKNDLERIKYLLAELAGQEEQLAGLLQLGLKQAQQSRADQITGDALKGRVRMCWQTFDQLRAVLAPITSMPGVETRLIGGLHSFVADSMLYAFDERSHAVFSVRGSSPDLQKALGYADGIQHESEQIMVLAESIARQIDTISKQAQP